MYGYRVLGHGRRTQAFAGFDPNPVNFDGTNDYISYDTTAAGAITADSKQFTVSIWARFDTAAGDDYMMSFYASTNHRWFLRYDTTRVQVVGRNSSGTAICDLRSSINVMNDTDWHHIMISVDLSDTGKRHMYIDNVSDLNVTTYTDDTIDFSLAGGNSPEYVIGARGNSGSTATYWNGDLAEVWMASGVYIDLSQASNRAKFISGGVPVNLGSDGSTPTGTAPDMYFTGATATWHENKADAGFTETGALTDGQSPVEL